MAIIMCAQLSILHNPFFCPPPRKAFLRPSICLFYKNHLAANKPQIQFSGRTALAWSSRAPKHWVSKWTPWGEATSHRKWHAFLVEFCFRQWFNDWISWAAEWHTLSCSGSYLDIFGLLGFVGVTYKGGDGSNRKKNQGELLVCLCDFFSFKYVPCSSAPAGFR